jgi:hypothetical protein
MSDKNWFKVETSKDKENTYHYYGSSSKDLNELIASLQRGEYIRLDDLMYMERSEYKSWADWDKSLEPSVLINPACVVTVMQYKADPRTLPAR